MIIRPGGETAAIIEYAYEFSADDIYLKAEEFAKIISLLSACFILKTGPGGCRGGCGGP
jgi:hypothetical protein